MPDLSAYQLVFRDDFESELNAYRGSTGVWSTSPRRDDLMTNGPRSVFLSDVTTTRDGSLVGIDPFAVENGVLHIRSGVIPTDSLPLVREALEEIGRAKAAEDIRYFTGMISTADTWSQAYGYYEITAEIPVGKGHWPAFWLAPAGIGWPPEIDIFEAYGRSVDGSAHPRNNMFSTAVYFDKFDTDGLQGQAVSIRNPFDLDEDGEPSGPIHRQNNGGEQYVFQKHISALEQYGADIYDGPLTWAAEWTPGYIAFYFGVDPSSLQEVFRTPTPEDVMSPMYMIINNQIGSRWGWNPVEGMDDLTFHPENDFKIHSVSVYGLLPQEVVSADRRGATIIDGVRSTQILDSLGDDTIVTGGGAGQDYISLAGGQDILHFMRGTGNVILTGFGNDDRLVLEGFYFDGSDGALARLTQVGEDVWLSSGAYPANPQTVVFRGSVVADFEAEQFVVRWSVTPDVWSSLPRDGRWIGDSDGDGIVRASDLGDRLHDAQSTAGLGVTLFGGAGGDRFRVYRRDTVISEERGHGVDTVETARSFVLPENVENIIALPSAQGIELAGNAADNRVEGNLNSNILRGGKGHDLIITSNSRDIVAHSHGDGHDVVEGFSLGNSIKLENHLLSSWSDLLPKLSERGRDLFLDLGQGGSITFRDASLVDIAEDSFMFVPGDPEERDASTIDPYGRPSHSSDYSGSDPHIHAPPDHEFSQTRYGSNGNDTLRGTAGGEVMLGLEGDDLIRGFDGNDWLDGGLGTNHLNGGAGDDTLVARGIGDRLFGDVGSDIFVLTNNSRETLIMDFGTGDQVHLGQHAASIEDVSIVKAGNWYKILVEGSRDWEEVSRVRTGNPDELLDAFIF